MRAPGPVAVVALAALAWACTSPEATRQRAGGPGGDVGNHGRVVQMHEGSIPFHGTPARIQRDVGLADLEPARHADRLSRGDEGYALPR